MKRLINKTATLLAVLFLLTFAPPANAATIFESGTLGPTGKAQGTVPATNVNEFVYTGVRFQLEQPVVTSRVGGHFVSSTGGTFFGAIITLDDANDFPDSGNLESDDVLGHTELAFPALSDEAFGELELTLQPGFYALVFGSGLFGTYGDGAATRNNTDIGSPDYIAFVSSRWRSLDGTSVPFDNHRLVLKGRVIPEPSVIALVFFAALLIAKQR